jgi:hypothetical protein
MSFSNGYSYRRLVTISGASVAASVSDFPVLVKATVTAAHVTNASGYDIRFETTGGTQLDHQIEDYSSGSITAWVRMPSLTAGTDQSIYLYYGNSSVTADTESNPHGVWTAFTGVWFLSESTGGASAFKDSTSNANHMSSVGAHLTPGVTGQITKALSRDSTTTDLSRAITDAATNLAAGSITVMAWVKTNDDAQNGNAQFIWEESSGRFRFFTTGSTAWQWRVYKTSGTLASLSGYTEDQTWQHIAARVGVSGSGSFGYLNGSQVSTSATVDSYIGTNDKIAVLSSGTAVQGANGAISHLMIAASDLGSGWVQTAYNNQSAPTSFASVGTEDAGSSGSSGTSAQTLPSITQSAAGTRTVPNFSGTAASTLQNLSQAAAGKASYQAHAASTLPPLAQAAAGTTTRPNFAATASSTLPTLAQSAAGTTTVPVYSGTSSQTLPALAQAAAGSVPFNGSASSVLSPISQSADGTHTPPVFAATANQVVLPSLAQSASGTLAIPGRTGSADQTLPSLAQGATGTATVPDFAGTATQTLPGLTQSASATTGVPAYSATAISALPTLGQSAAGTRTVPAFHADASQVLPGLSTAAAGTLSTPGRTGTADSALPGLAQSAVGLTVAPSYDGSATTTLPALVTSAVAHTGQPGSTGTATSTLSGLATSATGVSTVPSFTGSIAATLPSIGQTVTARGEWLVTIQQTLPLVVSRAVSHEVSAFSPARALVPVPVAMAASSVRQTAETPPAMMKQ